MLMETCTRTPSCCMKAGRTTHVAISHILKLQRPTPETCTAVAQVVATRKALQHAQAELHVVGEELAQARREVSLTKREQVRLHHTLQQTGKSQPISTLDLLLSGPDSNQA